MPWWGWIVVGAVLLGSELFVPTDFYLVFLGISALLVGALELAGLGAPVWAQWLLFAAFSVASLVLARQQLSARFRDQRGLDVDPTLVGEVAIVRERIDPGATGRAELRGSSWTARNAGEAPLEEGTRTRVERVEGLLIHVRRET